MAYGYGIFCGKRCAEAKMAAGIPPVRGGKMDEYADILLGQAAQEKASQEQVGWTPLQVTGVVAGSLAAIALMVVVIKKAKSK